MNIIIFITAKDSGEAQTISEALLKKKLIACANIVTGVKSFFRWEGRVDKADEVLLVLKSQRKLFQKVVRMVKSLHSYQVPEIIALPIVAGDRNYLKWLNESIKHE